MTVGLVGLGGVVLGAHAIKKKMENDEEEGTEEEEEAIYEDVVIEE